ncbi:MAG: hypothetical protein Q9201_005513 [Fulgogasparrea decipioides]
MNAVHRRFRGVCAPDSQTRSSTRTLQNPIPLPYSYKVPNSDTTIRLGFGEPVSVRRILNLLLICEYAILESIADHGADGEIEWETDHRQMFSYTSGDDVRISIMNLTGRTVLWGELQSVIQGLMQYLVVENRGKEVVFRFRCGAEGEVGWGFLSKGGNTPGSALD